VGKAVPSMIIGTLQATNILLVAQLWFQIPFQGSFFVLYAGLILFLLAAVGIGIFVSSIAETMQQAMLYGFLLIMPFSLLSGLTTPITNMPQALQILTLANPLRYAITIAQRVYLEGVGISTLWPNLWPMAIIATITLGAATWMFRNRVT
jgi:ABC-2 type transport system permease protein